MVHKVIGKALPLEQGAINSLQRIVALAGIVLGVIAISLSLYFNQQQNDKTTAQLNSFTATSCERQHTSADQWSSVIAVISDLNSRSGQPRSPNFDEFVQRTEAIYNSFPACQGFNYNPKTMKATPK